MQCSQSLPCLGTWGKMNDLSSSDSKFWFSDQRIISRITNITFDDLSDRATTCYWRLSQKSNTSIIVQNKRSLASLASESQGKRDSAYLSVVRGSLSEVRLICWCENAENRCCLKFFGWPNRFGEMPVNDRTLEASESMDGYLSTVPTNCCRLCVCRRNGPNANKVQSPSTTLCNQVTDHGNKALSPVHAWRFVSDTSLTAKIPEK
ncbi:hypothetical protein AVEN_184897-1 [Araneus ventricosus]|uniref:Uncharacterized protein n=1 Tax=Araneus ventricosus TaxID=182803 RepID=A0A4Y2JW51_ARAVE|nr:hypothetical protein AVEN_184897-1 [Araneus ventricosus]